jgi:hypothetical protein
VPGKVRLRLVYELSGNYYPNNRKVESLRFIGNLVLRAKVKTKLEPLCRASTMAGTFTTSYEALG